MTPDQYTIKEFYLDVGDGHRLYVHDWGNPNAKVVFINLHGGPGNGSDDRDRVIFDPKTQRIVFFDQRGAGKSETQAPLANNTTADLVEDISRIADELGLESFVLVGGSWGSTLALAYGISHPERVKAMVIGGVFTGSAAEYDWLEQGGWRKFFPEVWDEYVAGVPPEHRHDPSRYHFEQALGDDAEASKRSVYEFCKLELGILKLDDRYAPESYDKFDPKDGLIEVFFMKNRCFMEDGFILGNASKLKMPVHIVQGRYDMVCAPDAAYNLVNKLPNGNLIWSINGHARQHEAKNIQRLLVKQLADADGNQA